MNASIKRALGVLTRNLLLLLAPASIASAATGGKVTTEHQRCPPDQRVLHLVPRLRLHRDRFVRPRQQTYGSPVSREVPRPPASEPSTSSSTPPAPATTLLQAVLALHTLYDAEFQVSNQYDWAALHATLLVTEIDTGAHLLILRVDVTLVGTSAIARDHENTNDFYGGGCHVLNRWKGTGRQWRP